MKMIDILLIEDNPGDIRLTREALKESKMNVNLHVVMDGVEGCNIIRPVSQPKRRANIASRNAVPREPGLRQQTLCGSSGRGRAGLRRPHL